MQATYSNRAFDEYMKPILAGFTGKGAYDLVIGIPFSQENENNLCQMLSALDSQLALWGGRKQLILCVGEADGEGLLRRLQEAKLHQEMCCFLLPEEISGRGMGIRACFEIVKHLEADLILLSAYINETVLPGTLIETLLTPIQENYDLVLGSMRGGMTTGDSMVQCLAAPLLEVFYGVRLNDPLGGIYSISHDLVEELASEAKFWTDSIGGFGADWWILTRALVWNKNLCEFFWPGVLADYGIEKRIRVFREIAAVLMEGIARDQALCLQEKLMIRQPDIIALSQKKPVEGVHYAGQVLAREIVRHCQNSQNKWRELFSDELNLQIEKMASGQNGISAEVWADMCMEAVLGFSFADEKEQQAILDLLSVGYLLHLLPAKGFTVKESAVLSNSKSKGRKELTRCLWHKKTAWIRAWSLQSEKTRPPLIPLDYMEYVPEKPIVLPKTIEGRDGDQVRTEEVYRKLRLKYINQFADFTTQALKLDIKADPDLLAQKMEIFMEETEAVFTNLFPGDLATVEGTLQLAETIIELVKPKPMFTIRQELLREMLVRFPPVNSMIAFECDSPAELLEKIDARDAVTYANLMEKAGYSSRNLIWLTDQIKPDSFAWVEVVPMILDKNLQYGTLPPGKLSNLNRITGRITIKPLGSRSGGRFPRTRYVLDIIRRIALAEHYSELFARAVRERKNIGGKIKNVLLDYHPGAEFSAFQLFEDQHHRFLVQKLAKLTEKLNDSKAQTTLRNLVKGYGVSQVLEDGTFLTYTGWSWASYSFKGGKEMPGALSTSVEERWFNHDFLEEFYAVLGYDPEEIMPTVYRYILNGKSARSLLDAAWPALPQDTSVVIQGSTLEPARLMTRHEGNPMLKTVPEHDWEAKYVLNPGALRIDDRVYLFYRAVGRDDVSRIGLAITDGYRVLERLSEPVFAPNSPEERQGCEDPRLVIIEDRIWMLYTAYDGNIAQIAAASLAVEDFLTRRFDWRREGLAFENIWDKDAILFPEKINGVYVLYHRIEPSVWLTYLEELTFPCWEQHAIILGPRPGHMWDSLKIGAGAQPLKTKYGWLLIYHGVDHNYVYRLGVVLVDRNDPKRILYRSPNAVLEPIHDYELGTEGAWVPNVVFTCGAVAGKAKEILDDDDEILVYYGAADTSIGMAHATVAELIPQKYRKV